MLFGLGLFGSTDVTGVLSTLWIFGKLGFQPQNLYLIVFVLYGLILFCHGLFGSTDVSGFLSTLRILKKLCSKPQNLCSLFVKISVANFRLSIANLEVILTSHVMCLAHEK